MNSDSKIILALDFDNYADVAEVIRDTSDFIKVYKLGLEFFTSNGPLAIQQVVAEFPLVDIFLDLKLHDIPNTVAKAAASLQDIAPRFLTVHAAGGGAMIEAAAKALPGTFITAVTVLTSLNTSDLAEMGLPSEPLQLAVDLAKNSVNHGARAVVCSPLEVKAIRNAVGPEVTLITPGVRPDLTTSLVAGDDQQRVATPKGALADGADFVVIGRPITQASDRRLAAQTIFESLI